MSKPARKPRLPDANVTAFLFVQRLTGEPPKADEKPKPKSKRKPKK